MRRHPLPAISIDHCDWTCRDITSPVGPDKKDAVNFRLTHYRGRGEGVGAVKAILDKAIPGFAPDARLKFANQIVDALLDKSVSAQLSREAPSAQDQFQQEADKLNAVLRAPSPTLLQQVPVGVSVTIHFELASGRTAVTGRGFWRCA